MARTVARHPTQSKGGPLGHATSGSGGANVPVIAMKKLSTLQQAAAPVILAKAGTHGPDCWASRPRRSTYLVFLYSYVPP